MSQDNKELTNCFLYDMGLSVHQVHRRNGRDTEFAQRGLGKLTETN